MRKLWLLLACCTLTLLAAAQSKQKAEREFLQQLSQILKKSAVQHWGFEGKMTVDSTFAINRDGLLSLTVRYHSDTGYTRSRMVVPMNKIREVAYDLYIILRSEDDQVIYYESENNKEELHETGKGYFFHIGAPLPEDVKYQEKLQKALDKVLKFYR
ncbi:MAG: hypothetical protein JWQ27_2474 [Ferruginibacter sp.]|nr:hypothetical protein [Ferruginibacter sp.]